MDRLAAFEVDRGDLVFRDEEDLQTHLYALEHVAMRIIGHSREGAELYGVHFGRGARNVSIIAGCHADEPVGPLTAQLVARILSRHFPELLEAFRFHVIPQMNPDGANRNRPWFSHPPELSRYLSHALREGPGEDIEFGFGDGSGLRPECSAAQDFLGRYGPYAAHFSLHGMGFAEGAWCLVCKERAGSSAAFMDAFSALCSRLAFPLHDVDRGGEKGFTRLREGFCTTPTSGAMKAHFLNQGDPGTAGRFRPSSMEWIRTLGGDPLCIVSEIPIFLVGERSPSLLEPISKPLRDDLARWALAESGPRALEEIVKKYKLSSVALELQLRLQVGMLVLALSHACLQTDEVHA